MSAGTDDPAGLGAALARLRASGTPGVLTASEAVLGRLVLKDHHLPAECDPFVNHCFDLTETGETVVLTTETRVHEQVELATVRLVRSHRVAARLRREEAEIRGLGTEPVDAP